jgi:hypothetical protein
LVSLKNYTYSGNRIFSLLITKDSKFLIVGDQERSDSKRGIFLRIPDQFFPVYERL